MPLWGEQALILWRAVCTLCHLNVALTWMSGLTSMGADWREALAEALGPRDIIFLGVAAGLGACGRSGRPPQVLNK